MKKRPVNLNLLTMHFPPMAIVSILHRITGVALTIFFPIILYFFHLSLQSPDSFAHLLDIFSIFWVKLILFVFLLSLFYHAFAGIRHIIMDIGYGDELIVARQSAIFIIVITFIMAICLGRWLW